MTTYFFKFLLLNDYSSSDNNLVRLNTFVNVAFDGLFILTSFLAELGDYQPEEHGPNYLSNLQLVPGQTPEIEAKISELHKLHKYID